MASLFIDTSHKLTFGILDENYHWLVYEETDDKKSSAKIHKYIYDALANQNLQVSDIHEVFGVAGPGSYTGMRVTEGILQIFELNCVDVYSFYHFQVPYLLNTNEGLWLAKAFKGEFFLYRWDGQESGRTVVSPLEFEKSLEEKNCFFAFENLGDNPCQLTNELIRDQPSQLFSLVKKGKLREEIYYFRPLSDEFKVSKRR